MNLIEDFSQELFRHLTRSDSRFKGGIIKTHSENFQSHGEFSFPLNLEPWKHYLKGENIEKDNTTILDITYPTIVFKTVEEIGHILVEDSKLWTMKIEKCLVADKRIYIFLDRSHAVTRYLLNQPTCGENLLLDSNRRSLRMFNDEYNPEDLSSCRFKHFLDVSRELLRIFGYSIADSDSCKVDNNLFFTMKSANKHCKEGTVIYVAPILNDKRKSKEVEMLSTEYLKKRTMDMQLIAMHKFGLRIKDEDQWKIFLERIGKAAVIFDLLQNKPTNPLSINGLDGASGSSKGVSFVLYNCARLATLIKKYQANVESGLYPELPPVEQVDLSLINDSDEWILIFNFMMGYPNVLRNCVNLSSRDCPISPHLLCNYLSGLAGRFSIYYRRIRVLLEPRSHLLPVVQARMHFLLALQNIFHHGLSILNIVPVTQM